MAKALAVVVPTYNEAENIAGLLEDVFGVFAKSGVEGWVVVVDDNSPDGTADVAESLSAKYGRVRVLRRPGKLGLGSAYRDGFRFVLENLGVEYVAEMDADGSHPPEDLAGMLDLIERSGADGVLASRYVEGGGWGWGSAKRLLVSRGANLLARISTGMGLSDMTSGYRLYRVSAIRALDLDKLDAGYVFQVQILYELAKRGFRIVEYPFVFRRRAGGGSKLGASEFWIFFKWCVKTLFKRMVGHG